MIGTMASKAMDEISVPTPFGERERSARFTMEIGYGWIESSKVKPTCTVSGSYAIIIHHFSNSVNPPKKRERRRPDGKENLSSQCFLLYWVKPSLTTGPQLHSGKGEASGH
jgi:hypothetical protein